MTWILLVLGAIVLWSFVNISDQYLVGKYSTGERTSGGLVLFSSLVGVIVAVLIGIFTHGIWAVSISDILILMLTGGLTIAWVILYFYTMEIEDVSAVVPWFLTVPIFSFIFGYIFLGETLSNHQLIGSAIVILGAAIISIDFKAGTKAFKLKPALYMSFACLMIALSGVLFKYVAIGENFWISSFWEYVGLGLIGICLYFFVPKYRNEFTKMNREGGVKIIILNSLSEGATIIGNLLNNFALLLAPVTMVYLVGSFQPVVVIFITLLGTKFFPKIVTEDMSMKVLLPKIIAIVVMIAGSAILFI